MFSIPTYDRRTFLIFRILVASYLTRPLELVLSYVRFITKHALNV